ncbi:MAG TPA: tetratricopeptide repeat protein [Pyrinomonadaceae bacterium]|nr:tetratricopeptide repeat protein [Pyrinomonadaceae bacterium]
MNPLQPHIARAHKALTRELFVLERTGEFDRAFSALRGIWEDTTETPLVDGLDRRTSAEMFLRCGALIGFLGHIRQIPTSQERSKNLLTRARSIFLEIYDNEKIAECENYLALAYWRTGEINEAESWVDESFSHELLESSDTRLYSHVIRNVVRFSQKRFVEIQSSFKELEKTFLQFGDDFLIGNFYMNFGIASRNLGDTAGALLSLETARNHFVRSGNKIQVAMAENNLSHLYKHQRRFRDAHDAIDRASELFREIGDRTREGYSYDTKAAIYFDEKRFDAALETVNRAISILGTSENFGYLTDTITTKAKIQLHLQGFSTATLTLLEAVDLAKVRIGEEAAHRLVCEFEQALEDRNAADNAPPERTGVASGDLQLVLPPSISHYKDYQGVWITNSDLESHGLSRGSLAVVVPTSVKRGDLVAVMEIENESVSCGFYDTDFGIVCLEAGGAEPQLFDKTAVKVLGKIVGVCRAEKVSGGTVEVEPIDL